MFAGDLEIKAAEQRVEERRKAAEGDPDNEQLALQLEEADRSLQELKLAEYSERVEKYPTDRKRKYDLGTILFRLGRTEEAMAQFQAIKMNLGSKRMPPTILACASTLKAGLSRQSQSLTTLSRLNPPSEKTLDVKYDLMLGLIKEAEKTSKRPAGQGHLSEIARTNIMRHSRPSSRGRQ